MALADAFGCSVNELPLSFVLSWYEQKAVCILLTLLHLGIKNIRLGPSLPAFLSPNILNFLVENYGIAPITTPEEDIKALMNQLKVNFSKPLQNQQSRYRIPKSPASALFTGLKTRISRQHF